MWQAEVNLGGLLNFWREKKSKRSKNTDSCGTWRQKRRQHWMKPKMLFSQFCCQLWSKQIRGSLVRECGKIVSASLPSHTGEKLKLGGSWFSDSLICWFADLQDSHWRKDKIGRLLIWRLTLHCWEGGKQANKLQRCLFSKHLEKLQKEFVQQTPSKSVKENVELPLLRRKLDQTNFLFYPTEDKVSPPLPSISPLDSLWKTTKAKEREFLTRVWTLTCEWTAG